MSSFDVGQGGSTLDLAVVEVWSWCGQMDLASAYVLRPLNCLVLDFVAWSRVRTNERRSGGILDRRCWRGLVGSEGRKLEIGTLNDWAWRANLVDIRTGSTVHWRLAFITMGDYVGLQAQQGDE